MSLYEGAVKKPIMTSLCFLAVVIFGLFSLSKLPIDLYPDIDTNTIMVMTAYPGASASDIENNVTRPLENTLNAVSNLKHITSRSSENMSLITLEFEYGNDIDVLTNDVRDKLDMVSSQLPDDVENPIIFKFSTDMIPIVLLSVQANESQSALYKILDDRVVNPLARIPGVGTVSISGAPQREIQVYCDPGKLEAYNLTIETISSIIGAENKNIPGGNFDIGNETYSLRVEGEFDDSRQLEDVVVGSYNGANVYLRDVARVVDTVEERAQETYNNGVKGAMIVVQKQSGANSVDISKKVAEALPKLQKNLPSDVKLGVIVDTSDNILNTIDSLAETVLYALLFVVIVVFLFLGRWRATLIICITIPLSLIASFIYLAVTGNTINIISLSSLSIAIGMVVDDAIVVLENITTHIEKGSSPREAAIYATNEVWLSVIATTLVILAVFMPLTMLSGMAGIMFRELGWIVSIVCSISTCAAISLTPMLSAYILHPEGGVHTYKGIGIIYKPIDKFLDNLDIWYAKLLNWAVRHRATVVTCTMSLFGASLLLLNLVPTEFFPAQDNGSISATVELEQNIGVDYTARVARQIDSIIYKKYPEVRLVAATAGASSSDNLFSAAGDNGSNIVTYRLRLPRLSERKRDIYEISDLLRQDLADIPEVTKFTVTPGGQSGSVGGSSNVKLKVFGYDIDETNAVALDLQQKVAQIPGARDVQLSRDALRPEMNVVFDREKLAYFGLNSATASQAVRNRINGYVASKYREDGDEYDIVVRYAEPFRTSIEDVENIVLYGAMGQPVKLKEVATVSEEFAAPTIERENRQRVVSVEASLGKGVALGTVVEQINQLVADYEVPEGVYLEVGGSVEDQQDSFRDLMTLLVLIVILVYIVMATQFESLKMPFIIMFSIPFAFTGVFIALWISGTPLSMIALIGAIMLVGIVVKNGIVMVDYTNLLIERGTSMLDAVVAAGKSRLRPVLMTSLTTIFGMVPMAMGWGDGSELWQPMGVAVIGGLTCSTFLTLLVVPTIYASFGVREQKKKEKKQRKLAQENA